MREFRVHSYPLISSPGEYLSYLSSCSWFMVHGSWEFAFCYELWTMNRKRQAINEVISRTWYYMHIAPTPNTGCEEKPPKLFFLIKMCWAKLIVWLRRWIENNCCSTIVLREDFRYCTIRANTHRETTHSTVQNYPSVNVWLIGWQIL